MEFKREHKPLILASKSPRRLELLESCGIKPVVIESEYEEEEQTNETPEEYAKMLSYFKALDVSQKRVNYWVLGADTIVVLNNEILGKPKSKEDAKDMIYKLSGTSHKVITGYSIISPEREKVLTFAETTIVRFRRLSINEIDWYIETDEPYDKAGAYGIQGKAASFVETIEGSYTNVVGLPLSEVIELMQRERLIN
jgi:septum formation protein